MRMPNTILTLASLLLGSTFAIMPLQAATLADAPSKQRLCQPCTMPMLPVALPRHGMVLAYGSFMATSSLWYMVDLERGEASRILANFDRTANKLDIVEQTTRPIPPDDLAALKQVATGIWASPDRIPSQMATDVTWDLWQLDGGDVRRDGGPGLPDGLAKDAERIIERREADPPASP